MLLRTVLAISLAIRAALGSAVSNQIATGHQNSGKSTAGLRADPHNIILFFKHNRKCDEVATQSKLQKQLSGKICQTPN